MGWIMKFNKLSLCLALAFAAGASQAADVKLTGDYLQVGVSNSGALITADPFLGLKYDPTGTGNFSGGDFLTPGTPFAFFSIGVNGVSATAGAGSLTGNPFGSVTKDFSALAGSPYAWTSKGTYNGLTFSQALNFDVHSSVIHSTISFTNTSTAQVNNVAYAVGFDPDQDLTSYGTFSTNNTINSQGLDASVSAYGTGTNHMITLNNTSGFAAKASITGWSTDAYGLSSTGGNIGNGDNTIALGYNIGSFAIHETKTLSYDYVVSSGPVAETITASVPEPETYAMLLAGLGLMGAVAKRRKAKQA
jgi:hypothetical protein